MTKQTAPHKPFSELLAEAISREKRTGIEICTNCAKDMDFPSSLHIHHPARYEGGANYVEGGGQTCASCAAKERHPQKTAELRPYRDFLD